ITSPPPHQSRPCASRIAHYLFLDSQQPCADIFGQRLQFSQDALGNQDELGGVFHLASITTHGTKVQECIKPRIVLVLTTFFVVPARSFIFNRDFNRQCFLSAHNGWVVSSTDMAEKGDRLGRGNSRRGE